MDGSVVFARWRQCALWSNTLFPDPIRLSIPAASRSVQPFLYSSQQSPYTLQWAAIHPPPRKKCSLVHGPLSNTWFLGSTLVHPKSTHRSVRPFLHGSQSWQTDHGTLSVAHTHTTILRPFFPGPPGWAGARRELLDFVVHGKINRGRHTDHPAGRHSIRTNQCPPPPFPHFLQAGCPSCRPTNSVRALKATYPVCSNRPELRRSATWPKNCQCRCTDDVRCKLYRVHFLSSKIVIWRNYYGCRLIQFTV